MIGEHISMYPIEIVPPYYQGKHYGCKCKVMSWIIYLMWLEVPRGIRYEFAVLHEHTSYNQSEGIIINHKPFGILWKGQHPSEGDLYFNNWKLFSQDFDHSNLGFFWVKAVNRDAIDKNPSTNLL